MRLKVRYILFIVFALLVFSISFSMFSSPVKADWLSGWDYRKSHTINAATDAGTNYQVKIVVHSGSGTDGSPNLEDVYLDGHAQNWPYDIRFTDDDQVTELDYWLESYDASVATFWVKVADDLSTVNAMIYVYYGKADSTTTSNIDNTFIFGDDFLGTSLDAIKWEWNAGVGTITVANSEVRIYRAAGTGIDPAIRRLTGVDPLNKKFEAKLRFATLPSGRQYGFNAKSNGYLFYWLGFTATSGYYLDTDGASPYEVNYGVTWATATNYIFRSAHKTGMNLYERDASSWSYTTTSFPSGLSLKVLLGFFSYGYSDTTSNTVDMYFDWVFIHKWVDPEPTHGSWGIEESPPVPPGPPQIRSLYFSTTLDQININWITEYSGATVDVECKLNGVQNCVPFPYSGGPGGGGCTILSPGYDMTPDPGGELRTTPNTIYCNASDPNSPGTYVEVTKTFYPISFEVFMPSSMSLVVGEEQDLVITVKNNGTLSDTYGISVVATDPGLLIIENGAQTTASLSTNDVQQIYVGVNALTSEQTTTADVSISSDTSQSPNKIESGQTLTVRGGVISLPDFGFFGIIQIMFIAAVVLVSFLF